MISQQLTGRKLPDMPGVYTFVDDKNRPLYIGRATSLRDRVRSYFSADLIDARGSRIVDMVTRSKTVKWQITDSVLEAIILESNLIRRYQPYYNVDERDDKSSQYVVITDESWPRVFLVRARNFDSARPVHGDIPSTTDTGARREADLRLGYNVKRVFGPYPHGGLIRDALKILRKIFPFKDRKSSDARHDDFYRALGRSPSDSDANARRRYLRTIDNLILFFEGKKDLIRRRIERDMAVYSKTLRFEDAGQCKRILYALDHINDVALIKNREGQHSRHSNLTFRIEAYDVAHLSGTHVVGAFVASINGDFAPAEYRTFNLSRQANDDVNALAEIIIRRLNHPEWTYPDLIVVDGNKIHVTHTERVLRARHISIPVVGVTKDERHKAARFVGRLDIITPHKRDIVALNAEAHRFVIKYHRRKRKLFS